MAVTQNTYTGDGSTVLFSFTFPYLETTDIKVSLDGTITTAYILANATTIQFNTAPTNGVAIRIYRQTDDAELAAQFYPGSAIRSQDLNDNFTQGLYVTQESSNNASTALTAANTAISTANAATTTANGAVSTANTALSTANTASSTANAASAAASSAVSTANTAASDASAAVVTADAASAAATAAVATANGAAADTATALSTAITADANATTALSTANAASSTATTAASNAATALSTANTALSNANSAVTTANSADAKADAAIAAIGDSLLFTVVATVAAIPASPDDGDAIEVTDATGIESFTPLSGIPYGFIGDSGLSVRIRYATAGSSWIWLQYFPNDPDNRYSIVELVDGGNFDNGTSIVNGSKTLDGGQF
jgi:hypothetical protein